MSLIFFSAIFLSFEKLLLFLPVLWSCRLQTPVCDSFTVIQFMFYNAIVPWLALASFLMFGILLGKSLCGWVCPFGFVQDLIGLLKRKKTEFSLRTHGSLLYIKYFVLGIALFISLTFFATRVLGISESYENALGIFVKLPFTAISPAETLFGVLPYTIQNFSIAIAEKTSLDVLYGVTSLPPLFWVQLVIMISVLVFVAYVPKGWCKYFCPHGAFMAVLNKFSFLGLRRDPVKCTKGSCRLCVEVCPMRVQILNLSWEKFSDPECIYCLKCVDACHSKAIKIKYP